jgi:hypothetical protein
MIRAGAQVRAADRRFRVACQRATAKGARLLHEGRRRRVAALAALDAADRQTVATAADILDERMLAGPAPQRERR